MRIVRTCWRPAAAEEGITGDEGSVRSSGRGGGRADGLLWYKDLGRHAAGEFSFAVVQANGVLEDGSQIESGPLTSDAAGASPSSSWGTFAGVYDGHGGPETARYVTDHLFRNLKKVAAEQQGMSADVIRKAYSATEEGFLSVVKEQWLRKPQIASVGSCCLVGVICNGILYVANAGDSRAVLGRWVKGEIAVTAVQMSTEHNAHIQSVREELRSLHPDDPQIVVLKHKVWRVKGIIQQMIYTAAGGNKRNGDNQIYLKQRERKSWFASPLNSHFVIDFQIYWGCLFEGFRVQPGTSTFKVSFA
ncbi:putative protein phosphatase 2C 46 [Iris pallida]|uniref:protein-serine/threonine phosphatase n=1 Tax=Iris pallida TaxID=29817 RepID=A0AAX6GSA2_IRIPA|nr:putative protein phosphatase 2C 46 [Iris pallida]KAJ6831412.1 putative protein phosphatase 2C 46 [Iris pallida]